MKIQLVVLVLFLTFQSFIFGQQKTPFVRINNLEIPKTNPKDVIVSHVGYRLLYNENCEQASWVAYELTKEETNKRFDRTNKFLPDPKIQTASAEDTDYKSSGYDRGHLAPASDMGWSSITMAESFYYSNMSPQVPSFNRGIWKNLEGLVRTWAIENQSIYVVTGPVLTNGLPTIGPDKVAVPEYYYKVILYYGEHGAKGIGFILPNRGSKAPLQNFAVPIDEVEKSTGIDFFPLLEDKVESLVEKTRCLSCWSWKVSKAKNTTKNQGTSSVQCNGITKAGKQCKNNTLNPSGYCYRHVNQNHSVK